MSRRVQFQMWIEAHPRTCAAFFFCCALALYAPTLNHGYVFDDKPLFTENIYVQKGWAGIPELMTKDAFASQYAQQNAESHLTGGRYRPLSLVTFAVEVALTRSMGDDAPARLFRSRLSHGINIVLYALLVALLYQVLRVDLFKTRSLTAWLAAWLFLLHPIHCEVVINVKSRDELLSLIFILLALQQSGRRLWLFVPLFILALLAKEYAITLVILAPLYVAICHPQARLRPLVITMLVVTVAYIALRFYLVGWSQHGSTGILNDPYQFATNGEKVATSLFVLLRYIGFLFWPHPLAYDYSYNQIPYRSLFNGWVLCSAIIHGMLAVAGIRLACKRSVVGFAILFYGGTLFMVSNLLFGTGQMMAERFLFHPSLGFCLLAALGINACFNRPGSARVLAVAGLVMITGLAIARIENRIPDWKDEATLYVHDIKIVPENALACCNAGAKYMDRYFNEDDPERKEHYYNQGMFYALKAINLYEEDEASQLNLGLMHFDKKEYELAEMRWNLARVYVPRHPKLPQYDGMLGAAFYQLGLEAAKTRKWEIARTYFKKSILYSSRDGDALYYLGGTYVEEGNWTKADEAWRLIKPVTWMGFDEEPVYTLPND
ncbi:MAG: tetratricopeptide (TPR) repeat protein [Candidatus Omnitrophota bacterium]|jgi:tetratricopeptide (TPR) repeat protein